MNASSTLVDKPSLNHIPEPFLPEEAEALRNFYQLYGAENKSAEEKNQVLMKRLQARSFYAFGGNETPEMELRANERIFLIENGF